MSFQKDANPVELHEKKKKPEEKYKQIPQGMNTVKFILWFSGHGSDEYCVLNTQD